MESAAFTKTIMGPDVAIGSYSWAFQWAHPAPSAALPKKIMGPDVAIGSRSWASQRAHPTASAELPEIIMGPAVAIGSCIRICNGPTPWHRQNFLK